MMKKFREWEKLNEIGDRIITPSKIEPVTLDKIRIAIEN